MQTISFFYDDYRKVQRVLAELEKFGMPASVTKLSACDADEYYRAEPADNATADDAAFGTAVGGVAGMAVGALAAVGVFAAPGLEPLIAMGVLATSTAFGTGGAMISSSSRTSALVSVPEAMLLRFSAVKLGSRTMCGVRTIKTSFS